MADTKQQTILIVDDGAADRQMIRALLLRAPGNCFVCFEARSCEQALELCRVRAFDCILLDYTMPDMDGIMCLNILQREGFSHVPVILVTAFGSEPLAVNAFRTGVQDYLRKDNLDTDTLIHAIRFAVYKKQAERVMLQRELDLRARTDEMNSMSSMVTHDLKSPLTTIQVFLGYLERNILAQNMDRAMDDVSYIRKATEHMQSLIEGLLDVSHSEHVAKASEIFTLQEIVREALFAVAGPIAQKKVQVKLTEQPVSLQGDRAELVCLFQNLIDNAVKFTGDQDAPRIDIGVEHVDNETVFYVRDNGCGLEPGYRDMMFVMFERFDSTIAGSGIGLALVKKIVEAHGGRIRVESEGLGKGTCFRFTLPRKQVQS